MVEGVVEVVRDGVILRTASEKSKRGGVRGVAAGSKTATVCRVVAGSDVVVTDSAAEEKVLMIAVVGEVGNGCWERVSVRLCSGDIAPNDGGSCTGD